MILDVCDIERRRKRSSMDYDARTTSVDQIKTIGQAQERTRKKEKRTGQ